MLTDRRTLIGGMAALGASACVPIHERSDPSLTADLSRIERRTGGRLGVGFLDPGSGATMGLHSDERFPMASTFKTSLAALTLVRAQDGAIDLDEEVRWSADDLLSYAPFARERIATGASWRELARAAQILSDNTAANLLLAKLGGPAALTAFWRGIGDDISRLDRIEPELNNVPTGEWRDTTTPAAMAQTIARLVASPDSSPLSPGSADTLRDWMVATETGLRRVRAGLPATWLAGDKTGNSGDWDGMGYTRGDIGFCRGPASQPICFAIYHQAPVDGTSDALRIDTAFAEVGEVLAGWVRRNYTIIVT
ncbi:class A beta-lactamase [Qipengyuania sp.]|uniref:class A beta-lactamase n=1 Tax=Qipengyuania sp. TaxID=2004515 RepID=UPI0035C85515